MVHIALRGHYSSVGQMSVHVVVLMEYLWEVSSPNYGWALT